MTIRSSNEQPQQQAATGWRNLIDPDEVRRSLSLIIAPDQVTEIRILNATTYGDRYPGIYFGYFDTIDKIVEALREIKSAQGFYFVPNPIKPALLARCANRIKRAGKGDATGDRDIMARERLLIDCDSVRPSGISSTDAEHEAALKRAEMILCHLRDEGWGEPIFGDSGNGAHLLYGINLPADDGGKVKQCLKSLASRFDDDLVKVDTTVFNQAQLWKLYGTRACKGDHTPERPHRMARIIRPPATEEQS